MVSSAKETNIPIDGTTIKENVLHFAEKFNFPNFKAYDGWIEKSGKVEKRQGLWSVV